MRRAGVRFKIFRESNELDSYDFYMLFNTSKVLENVGMTLTEPIEYEGKQIIPLQFLKVVLNDPARLLGPREQLK